MRPRAASTLSDDTLQKIRVLLADAHMIMGDPSLRDEAILTNGWRARCEALLKELWVER
jgi:hypothetical protein